MSESPLDQINRLLDAVDPGGPSARGDGSELDAWLKFGEHGALWQAWHWRRKPSRRATRWRPR